MRRRILGDRPADPWADYDAAVAETDAALARLGETLGVSA